MSLEIIIPRVQGGNSDGAFIERYADRKMRLEREREGRRQDLPLNAKSQAQQYDPDFKRQFCRLYACGMSYKRIAIECAISERKVARLRKFYDLPFRTDKHNNPSQERVGMSFDLPYDLYRKMDAHCSGRYQSKAHFLRALLRERLG